MHDKSAEDDDCHLVVFNGLAKQLRLRCFNPPVVKFKTVGLDKDSLTYTQQSYRFKLRTSFKMLKT